MAKEKAVVTTGVEGREVYESPSFSINYTQMVGSSGMSLLGPIPKINTKKIKLQFDPSFKNTKIYEQTLDGSGANIPLSNNELITTVGVDGKYTDVNTSNYPGIDASLANKNSILNKTLAKQIIDTYREGFEAKFGRPPTQAETEEGIGRSSENLFKADAVPLTVIPFGGKKEDQNSIDLDSSLPSTGTLRSLDGTRSKIQGKMAKPVAGGKDLIYPLDRSEDADYISFTALEYSARAINNDNSGFSFGARETKKIGGTVALPIQSGISDSFSVGYNEDTMNPIQAEGAKIAKGAMNDRMKDALADTANKVQNATGEMSTMIENVFAGEAVGANILTRMTGGIMNPNLELLFQAPQLRPFNFNFRLTPRSADEGTAVKQIIKFFKQNMAPQQEKTKLFLKTPNVFNIEYKHRSDKHKGLNSIKGPCALTAMNVDYTSEGTYMTFEDGTMISYVVSLSFMELEPVYNSDYDEFGEDEIGF